jgi:peptidoglycan hydrolase-like protein with peptidoglycan-binding domain
MRPRRVIVAGAVGVAAVAAAVILADGGEKAGATRNPEVPTTTATVERRDLVDRETINGTLGYADESKLAAAATGTLTAIRKSGSVVRRGQSLYDIDDQPAAWLLYGSLPAWRDFTPWMSDGEDIRQLERNLRALGYDPDHDMTIDDDWTAATTAAVERFQDDRDMTEDGTLDQGEVVFRDGPARVGEVRASVGQQVGPGTDLGDLSSTQREVTVALEADRQDLVDTGDTVTVEMPNGNTVRGRVTDVGEVATQPHDEDQDPTIDVTIALRGRAARGTGLDQAPVSGGGFAVETTDGRLVPVEPGMYAEDYVEVSGSGLREGMRVVTAE